MKSINLRKFSVDELLILRDRINTLLESRVAMERRDLETRLKRLQGFQPTRAAGAPLQKVESSKAANNNKAKKAKAKVKSHVPKKVAAKFRNPNNTAETWSGRGLQPRWLRAALEAGQGSVEDFRIQ